MSIIRDRIIDFRRVPAADLRPHPRNWRKHPDRQRAALSGVLRQIGYAGALIARRRADGELELIDGHLRAETTPEQEVPVLIVDLDEREADALLAVHDPLAALAETDETMLQQIIATVEAGEINLTSILGEYLQTAAQSGAELTTGEQPEPRWEDLYQVVVDCGDEQKQRAVYERLVQEGFRCRVLSL